MEELPSLSRTARLTRPWHLIALGSLFIFIPLLELLLSPWFRGTPYLPGLRIHAAEHLSYFLTFPLIGISILLVRPWSYLVALGLLFLNLAKNLDFNNPTTFSTINAISILLLGLIIGFFLLPTTYAHYMERKLRWWVTAPRFLFQVPCRIGSQNARIRDICSSGAFIEIEHGPEQDRAVVLDFEFLSLNFSLPGRVVRKTSNGIAISFLELPVESAHRLHRLIKAFQALGFTDYRAIPLSADFQIWFESVFQRTRELFRRH